MKFCSCLLILLVLISSILDMANGYAEVYYSECLEPNTGSDPWWRLYMTYTYRVNRVVFNNRLNCGSEQITGAELRIGSSDVNNGNSNPLCAIIDGIPANESHTYYCNGLMGYYINVFLPGDNKNLSLCELWVYREENLATGAAVIQSSTWDDFYAERAIDGRLDSPCTETVDGSDPWWRLDLQAIYRINSVVITNVLYCCADRINGAEIRIGNSLENNGNNNPLCAVITSIALGQPHTYNCSGMEGRYLNVFIPGNDKILSMCEVEVFGELSPSNHEMENGYPKNLASGGGVIQSSTSSSGSADKAIDGKLDTFTESLSESDPWWRVDLGYTYRVDSVVISNRLDCCSDQINGAEIHIGNSLDNNGNNNPLCAVISGIPAGQSYIYSCGGMVGRYVNVFLPGAGKILNLCEVEVYKEENLAQGAAVLQSSTWFVNYAEKAIDGKLDSTCTQTIYGSNPWWRLDLGAVHCIDRVVITNNVDCCPQQIVGAEIRIGKSLENNGNNNPLCAVISGIPAGESYTYSCSLMEGRYVNVFLPGDEKIIAMCEVAVFAGKSVVLLYSINQ
ncbi:uncharacterized protein [Misgurnus anguillicaudatus]|uniref:uncharacterized protein n=1 Tax=Misgurnus anguillicaudatus TaxID=75329 RepID=UPI003CCF7F59